MPYNLNMKNIIIHNKTHDMLPSISSTILHERYSEHANSKSVQSSPIWRYIQVIFLGRSPASNNQKYFDRHERNVINEIIQKEFFFHRNISVGSKHVKHPFYVPNMQSEISCQITSFIEVNILWQFTYIVLS